MSSYAMMGRPADLGYQRIDVIEAIDDIDDIEVVEDNLQGGPWYVQIDAGDVRVLSSEQVRDFHRIGVISDHTYIWQQGMQQWLPLSKFLGEPVRPPKSEVHSELPTQPYASSRAPAAAQQAKAPRPAPSTQTSGTMRKVTAAQPVSVPRPVRSVPPQSPRSSPPPSTAPQSATARSRTVPLPSAKPNVSSASSGASLRQLAAAVPGAVDRQPTKTAGAITSAPAAVTSARAANAPPSASAKPTGKAAAAKYEVDEDEPFSVLMGPGEVKTILLEQLVDFYRLEVIDDQTYIWQKGMSEWTQLATILGPDEDEPSNDIWYVQVAPGEIKTLTLEQLDDFYRLDVVDDNTLVCQPGWPRAYPLGMVAGIEAEPARPTASPVVQPAAAQSYAKPAVVSMQPSPARTAKPPAAAVSIAPQPTATFVSNAPVAFSIPVPESPRQRGSWTVRLAIAAGVLLTLFRNDVVYSAADAVSQKGQYLQTEQRVLGGPIFGTTRAVDTLLAETGGRLKPVKLPWIVTETQERKGQAVKQAALAAAEAPKSAPAATPSKQPEKPAETKSAASEPVAAVKADSNENVAAALAGASTKKFASMKPVKTVKPASMPKAAKKKGSGANGPFTGKGAYGDPLAM